MLSLSNTIDALEAAPGQQTPIETVPCVARVIVGGCERCVEGWGRYEAEARALRAEGGGGIAAYPGRTFVTADDAFRSLTERTLAIIKRAALELADALTRLEDEEEICDPNDPFLARLEDAAPSTRPTPPRSAAPAAVSADSPPAEGGGRGGGPPQLLTIIKEPALELADALARLEDATCEPDDPSVWECAVSSAASSRPKGVGSASVFGQVTIPPLTSADMRSFVDDPQAEFMIGDLDNDLVALAATIGLNLEALPPVVTPATSDVEYGKAVPIDDASGVLYLERVVAPLVDSAEKLYGRLAERMVAIAAAIRAKLNKQQ